MVTASPMKKIGDSAASSRGHSMNWDSVGQWVKQNAGKGASLVGSLLTGNLPGAVAAGVSIVSSATGTDDPAEALAQLQQDPTALIELKRIAHEEQKSIRVHLARMKELELADNQHSHEQTQKTVRDGDKSDKWYVAATRPAQSWLSLIAAITYVFTAETIDMTILGLLLTLPWSYAGLRQIGKGITTINQRKLSASSSNTQTLN